MVYFLMSEETLNLRKKAKLYSTLRIFDKQVEQRQLLTLVQTLGPFEVIITFPIHELVMRTDLRYI